MKSTKKKGAEKNKTKKCILCGHKIPHNEKNDICGDCGRHLATYIDD